MNERRYKKHPVSAGSVLRRATSAALRRRGFAEGEVITRWSDIVGPELAAVATPEKLQHRRGEVAGAVLHVRVAGAAAVELQHMAPRVIERINSFYGYRAVDRLKLVQGPLPKTEPTLTAPVRDLSTSESAALENSTDGTKNEELRRALQRLGAGILRRNEEPST